MRMNRWRWVVPAALLVVVGVSGSVFGALVVADKNAQQSHQSQAATSKEVASRLNLAIQKESDLAGSLEAFIVTNPNAPNTDFLSWVGAMQVTKHYPEVDQVGFAAAVRPAGLSRFVARILADPPIPLAPGQPYQVAPSGVRPYYCLVEFYLSYGGLIPPLDYDACAAFNSSQTPQILAGGTYLPYTVGKTTYLAVESPIYPGGVIPTTAQARTDTILGFVGLTVSPAFVLHQALAGHPGNAVVFHYGASSSKITFTAGSAPVGAQASTLDLQNGWSVKVFGAVSSAGLLDDPPALTVLLLGILISLLLGILIYTLGTSRSRAFELVDEQTEELHHLALHDPLTGLPNRALIIDRIELMLARSRREHTPVAILFLDLDNFKDINDTLGHAAGDQVLIKVGARLVGAVREEDTVGRLGGDEFVILAEGASLADGAEVVADRILDVLSAPFQVAGSDIPLSITASIGIAAGGRVTPGEMLQSADIALYEAKVAGKRRAVVFIPSMQEAVDDHRKLEVDLLAALEEGQFFLLYQPTVDLATGSLTGVEALLRWRHPTRGVVQPDQFIPALESSGLIVPVGRWVLEEACRQGARWQYEGRRITVSINISANQLDRDQIVDDVHRALSASSFDPVMCILEITETTLMHSVKDTVGWLNRLKALGVRLAIDDFGTGYSSMAYLQQFPLDVLKIDRSFVSGLTDTPESAALIRTMVQLGKALQLEIIAEGIENEGQLAHLTALNVDTGQGFLFAPPLDVGAVNRLLEEPLGTLWLLKSP